MEKSRENFKANADRNLRSARHDAVCKIASLELANNQKKLKPGERPKNGEGARAVAAKSIQRRQSTISLLIVAIHGRDINKDEAISNRSDASASKAVGAGATPGPERRAGAGAMQAPARRDGYAAMPAQQGEQEQEKASEVSRSRSDASEVSRGGKNASEATQSRSNASEASRSGSDTSTSAASRNRSKRSRAGATPVQEHHH